MRGEGTRIFGSEAREGRAEEGVRMKSGGRARGGITTEERLLTVETEKACNSQRRKAALPLRIVVLLQLFPDPLLPFISRSQHPWSAGPARSGARTHDTSVVPRAPKTSVTTYCVRCAGVAKRSAPLTRTTQQGQREVPVTQAGGRKCSHTLRNSPSGCRKPALSHALKTFRGLSLRVQWWQNRLRTHMAHMEVHRLSRL